MTVTEAQKRAVFLLSPGKAAVPSPSARLDADYLLSDVIGKEKSFLFSHPEYELSCAETEQFFKDIDQRAHGLPAAYITGKKEFRGIDFYVTQDVLIPKPDTEMMIDEALALISTGKLPSGVPGKNAVTVAGGMIRAADICTGSGCIIVSLLAACAEAIPEGFSIEAYASDVSNAALNVAVKNADTVLSKNVRASLTFYQGDLLDALPSSLTGKLNLVLSNPPYVPTNITQQLLEDGRSEPVLALDGGSDGLDIIKRLIPQVYSVLAPGGYFLLETGEYNAAQAAEYSAQIGFTDIVTLLDWGGQPRLMRAKKS